MHRKIRLFGKEENNRFGSTVQVEIRVEVDERVERLVRLTNVVREDGDSRPLNFEVLRTVEKGTEHEWHKIAERVAELFLEQVLDKNERAQGTSKSTEQKMTARCSGCTREIVFGFWKGAMWQCL